MDLMVHSDILVFALFVIVSGKVSTIYLYNKVSIQVTIFIIK